MHCHGVARLYLFISLNRSLCLQANWWIYDVWATEDLETKWPMYSLEGIAEYLMWFVNEQFGWQVMLEDWRVPIAGANNAEAGPA